MYSRNILTNSLQQSYLKLFPKQLINYLCADCERFRTFDPASTLYCFIFQVLNRCSCKVALLHFNTLKSSNNLKTSSMNTAAYSKAKKRLCSVKLKNIALEIGKNISTKTEKWTYKSRPVLLGDGTVIELEDTKSVKMKFPTVLRMGRQQGRPKMRLLSLFDASSGVFVDGEVGAYVGKGQAEPLLLPTSSDVGFLCHHLIYFDTNQYSVPTSPKTNHSGFSISFSTLKSSIPCDPPNSFS